MERIYAMPTAKKLISISFLCIFTIAFAGIRSNGADMNKIYSHTKDSLTVNLAAGKLQLTVFDDNIIRVLFYSTQKPPQRPSLIIVGKPRAGVKWNIAEGKNSVAVVTPKLRASVSLSTGAVTFLDTKGGVILSEAPDGGKSLDKAVVLDEEVFQPKQIFKISDAEGLYGLGCYQDNLMNYRGHDLVIAQANTIDTIPFLTSTRGYGILWDNYSESKFHDGPDGMSFWSEVGDAIDYYFVYGPVADSVVAGYRTLTGSAPMFGKWAYGYWQSKERYMSGDELVSVAKEYRSRKLPIDNIVLDWRYWGKYGWNAMKFDEDNFPHMDSTIADLHKLNMHIMISIWPKFEPITEPYKELDSKGLLYPDAANAGSKTYDAYSKEARDIYWRYVKNGLFSKGIDAWWMDATEPEITNADTQEKVMKDVKAIKKTALGTSARYLTPYSLMSAKGVYESQRRDAPDKRVFILTRSSFAGQQHYAAAAWSGDIRATWDIFKKQIPAGINFNMAGNPYWTTDIGAFFVQIYAGGCDNMEYREMYVRWFQFGAFCPLFRSHGTSTPREIWRFGKPGEWSYDALERADNLRYRLMPYIYSLAWQVTDKGYTIMRGLPMDFPNDKNARGITDQFMFGPALLVNPVTRAIYHIEKHKASSKMFTDMGAPVAGKIVVRTDIDTRDVYLPESAEWFDFWTGEKMSSGNIKAPAPIDYIPLYVRAGSIIPMGPFVQYAMEKPADPIELRIYPGADASFTIYEDDGLTYQYEKGKYALIPIKWDDKKQTLTIGARKGSFTGMLKSRAFDIVFVAPGHGVGLPVTKSPDKHVTYSGKEIKIKK